MIHKNIFFLGLLLLVPAFMNASDIKAGQIVTGMLELAN